MENNNKCIKCNAPLTSDDVSSPLPVLCDECYEEGWNSQFYIDEDGQVHLND